MIRIRFDGCDLSPRGARTPRYGQRIGVLAVAALLLLVPAGCGGGGGGRMSTTAYEHEVNGAGEQLSSVFGLVDQNTQTLNQFAIKVGRARKALDDVTSELAKVKPPKDAERPHAQLVAALRDLSTDLRKLSAAARTGSQQKTDRARRRLSTPAKKILQAIQQLQAAGFDVNEGSG
jgi:hypothetical protein